ncbi:MAG: hypothetical protein QM703_05620 [Gemmatales bacterium]
MSSVPTPPAPNKPLAPPPPPPPPAAANQEVIIYGHTLLFYWWPVWVFGYVFAALTWWGGYRAAIIPAQSQYDKDKGTITVPVALDKDKHAINENGEFREHMLVSSSYGILWVFILLLVIVITTVPLRGVSSLVVILAIALIVVTISFLGYWDSILSALGKLRVHMNMGFFVFTSTFLFIIWAAVFFVYDRMNYWRVTPGQITHKVLFGGGERSFDTEGMSFTKLRDDLFRHLILGIGSGDLQMDPMKTGGATKEELAIHNVLFIGNKLQQIDKLISKQQSMKSVKS